MCVGYISVAAFKNFTTSYLHYILPAKPAFFRFQTQSVSLPPYPVIWLSNGHVTVEQQLLGFFQCQLIHKASSQGYWSRSVHSSTRAVSTCRCYRCPMRGGVHLNSTTTDSTVLVCGIHLDKCTRNYTCKTDRSKVCWSQTADAEPRQWLMLG